MPSHILTLKLVFLVMSLQVGEASASDTLRFDLRGAVERAISVSPEVEEVAADLRFSRAREREARASRFLTEFNLTTAHAPAPRLRNIPEGVRRDKLFLEPDLETDWSTFSPFNQVEIGFIQPLFTWGELGGSIRAAGHGSEVEEARVEDRRREIALRTAELYYGVLLARELYRLADETGEVVNRAEREINRLLDEGDPQVDDADLFRLRIIEQEYRRRVVEVEEQLDIARVGLRRQLLLPDQAIVTPEEAILQPLDFEAEDLEYYQQTALVERPELKQANAGLAALRALVDVARSDYYPKLFMAGSARISTTPGRYRQRSPYIGDPLESRNLQAGVGFRQNLNFGITRARVQQAEANREQVEYQRTAGEQLILFEVEEAHRRLRIAEAALDAQREALQISREWLRTEQINFDLALGDTRNLVDAVRENLDLQVSYYLAVNGYNIAVLRLLNTAGVLFHELERGTFID